MLYMITNNKAFKVRVTEVSDDGDLAAIQVDCVLFPSPRITFNMKRNGTVCDLACPQYDGVDMGEEDALSLDQRVWFDDAVLAADNAFADWDAASAPNDGHKGHQYWGSNS